MEVNGEPEGVIINIKPIKCTKSGGILRKSTLLKMEVNYISTPPSESALE